MPFVTVNCYCCLIFMVLCMLQQSVSDDTPQSAGTSVKPNISSGSSILLKSNPSDISEQIKSVTESTVLGNKNRNPSTPSLPIPGPTKNKIPSESDARNPVKAPVNVDDKANTVAPEKSQTPEIANTETSTISHNSKIGSHFSRAFNSGAVLRGFYVFLGLGSIVIVYIVFKTFRLRRKKTTVHKYNILTSREDLELAPLAVEDDDEDDTTHFDARRHSRS